MPLVTSKELLLDAQRRGYAVGAFNANNMECVKAVIEAAEEGRIPYQFKKIPSGGTDAGSIHLTKGGVPSGTIAVPCRYIHGPASITTVEDIENTVKLARAFIEKIST